MSMLYEISGDYEKSYQLALIAAHLSPQDADEWLRLAEVRELLEVKLIIHAKMVLIFTDLSLPRR